MFPKPCSSGFIFKVREWNAKCSGFILAPVNITENCSSNKEKTQIIPSQVFLKINKMLYSGFTTHFIKVSV
jgi:hypothetical protein